MAMTVYMTLNGTSQGKIDGDVAQTGREKTIMGYALEHSVEMPRDTHSGLPTGQRMHKPLTITTAVGKHTPKIFQACAKGEKLTAQIDFYRVNDKGQEEKYYTVKLDNAIVVEAKEWFPETFLPEYKPYQHMNTVALAYEDIIWTYVPDGIETEDNWNSTGSSGA